MQDRLLNRIDEVDALLGERLHLSGPLRRKLSAARGRLPRVALRQARELLEAKGRLANPTTARALDRSRVEQTCAMLERHLSAVPEGKYRKRAWSAMIAVIALRVLAVLVLVGVVLIWRGFI
ncbi:hypothetical protein [Jannaschia sp. M317]|uniref:hypothetical protein n=1 Tax=Jannaschia sp. M317 TaxID=2867011 RepID=UPI0021A8D494|nr:hypothetical protein [Jannaschia sp. M317]UWQ17585.1 hypothetical protein K3551_17195 [Jannaschia sp. M317]